MYLSQLDLRNFRSFTEETVFFESGLTVLVGENNAGKSNLIDSIRLLSTPLSGRRELYCEQTDVRFGTKPRSFELCATFEGLTPPQQGRFLSATTDDSLQRACFGLTYNASDTKANLRPNLWAGRFKSQPEAGSHDLIRHVYLPPLRDAKRALASGNPTRIHALLNHFLSDYDPDDVAKRLARTSDHPILNDVDSAVSAGLEVLTAGVRRQQAALGFNNDEKLVEIARDLRFKLADQGIAPEDLKYSGHGFANLLYMATIAVELEKTDDAELTLFLVEEPEAHLHPQLQSAVLNFLEERAEQSFSKKRDENAPAGHLQVIVATHSPNLSAWVPSKRLVFVRSLAPQIEQVNVGDKDASAGVDFEAVDSPAQGAPLIRLESRCIPLSKLDLDSIDRRKIDRYLDVTKSALLFGGRVLLVEGIAEALMLPVIARQYVLKDRPDDLRKFRSAVFVPIDGVDFLPFAKALLIPYRGVRLADRLVIVTDGDKHTSDEVTTPGNRRKSDLENLAKKHGATDILHVSVNSYSLETELVASDNATCMRDVYRHLHPRSEAKWDEAVSKEGVARAKAIQNLFWDTPKGDFAQLLAEKIASGEPFNVPEYLRIAIESLVR